MAELLVDRLLNALTDVVISKLQEEFNLVTGVNDEVKDMSFKLQVIRRMLQDVQRRKLKEEPVGIWLEKLKNMAYDVDDVLDEWNTQVQKLKLKAEEDPNSLPLQLTKKNKVYSFLLSICSCFKQVPVRHDIAQKIKELNGRMNKVFQDANEFNFDLANLNSTNLGGEFKHVITTSIFNESEVYDRDIDKDKILTNLLPNKDEVNDGIRVVSIVGLGGIGKTTLAQLVFNDKGVKEKFELRKWVCVSDPFDQKRIAKAILEDLGKGSSDVSELETLLQSIKSIISGKKFLLVLDDVWTEDYTKWKPIRDCLESAAPGSRILVTTRSQKVAKMMCTNYIHHLQQLSDSSCWKILSRVAFVGRSENKLNKFVGIGEKISRKCKGSPLAANFLGSVLQSKDTVEEWRNVLNSEIWELKEAATDLFPHIYLSYNELSPEMKHCFLYCAVFPKDSEINVQDLSRQWIALGYISSSGKGAADLESRGYEYFINLAMRSFFQNFKRSYLDGKICICKMHDVVHDFAQHLMNGECQIIENQDEAKKLSSSSFENVHHLRWLVREESINSILSKLGKLRSFCVYPNCNDPTALEIIRCLKCVRALCLHGLMIQLDPVPKVVFGNLIHLRYLDMSSTSLRMLPEEICELYNLETLDVSDCNELTQFPERFGNLRNLIYLGYRCTDNLKQFPRGLEKLTLLGTLFGVFKVGNGYNKLEYLRNLNQLRGRLYIEFHEGDDSNVIDFECAKLGNKIHLLELFIFFKQGLRIKATEYSETPVPPYLQVLKLLGFPNSKLGSWILSLSNLMRLEIKYGNVASLPALSKLPSLEELTFEQLEGIEYLGREFWATTEGGDEEEEGVVVAFPKLKKLRFSMLPNWRIWEDLSEEDEKRIAGASKLKIMPCLEELSLENCYKLEMLPHRVLGRITSIKFLSLQYCDALSERYVTLDYDWEPMSHIPDVFIYN